MNEVISQYSNIHNIECLRTVEEIIDNLDERGLAELLAGNEHDVDSVLKNMIDDTYKVMFTGDTVIDFKPHYTERLSSTIEETMRCKNINYFITSCLPHFQMGWHHLEWGDLTMQHNKLCVIAARDNGKSIEYKTPIRMYDGTAKRACEVKVGDLLMGVDSKPRKVTAVYRGRDKNMYRIDQSKGDSYTVNSRHIMTLIYKHKKTPVEGEKRIVDIDIPEILKMSDYHFKASYRGFKVGYELPEKETILDPYFLGVWLGDRTSANQAITSPDSAKRISINNRNMNSVISKLRQENLLNNKHIPENYLKNSKRVRLQLLAGLIDTNGFHFTSKYEKLALQVKELADSLGFRASFHKRSRFVKHLNRNYESYDVNISGKLDQIPLKVERKKYKCDWDSKNSNKDWGTIDGITPSVVSSLKITNVGEGEYVSITTDGDKRFLLADGTVTHNSYYFSNAYAIWQLYRYQRPKHVSSLRPGSSHSNRGYLFSFSLQQAVDLMEILKNTIEGNVELSNRLLPDKRNEGAWASTNILCKNGARLTCKGFGSSVRGAHPYWIIVDDGLKDNVIYSQLQREKSISYFQAVIMNMLVPGGQIIVVGTPFHEADLYGDLKKKSGWFVIEYPSIFPNGKILWPSRWSYNDLMEKKEDQGNIIFSRENLCRPITSEASIFPMDVLLESIKGMDEYTLVFNRDDFPIKFNKVVVGCDFAISANVGADYSVFSVFGVDSRDHMWLLYMHRKSGQKYQEQMQTLRGINVRFRPDVMVLEQNAFQKIFFDEASREGMPVQGHTTGVEKNDLRTGWVHVSTLMSQGRVHIPVGDENSRNIKDLIFSDLGGIAFTPKGLENTQSHDDIGSSFWLASMGRNLVTTGNKFMFL